MSHHLTRGNLSALAKLDTTGLKHTERLEAMAKALGYGSYAALKAQIEEASASEIKPTPTPQRVIVAFGTEVVNAICNDESLTDRHGDPYFGEILDRTFASPGEAEAFLSGIAQGSGWERHYEILQGDQAHPYLEACKADPELEYPQWYAQEQASRAAEDAAYFEEE